jgi:hypothetical protein
MLRSSGASKEEGASIDRASCNSAAAGVIATSAGNEFFDNISCPVSSNLERIARY